MPSYNSWPAQRHLSGVLSASTAVAITDTVAQAVTNKYANTTLFRYKAIYFSVAGSLDVVDAYGTKVTITAPAGGVYPCQNYGGVTGGGTTLTNGQFVLLYD